MKNKTRKKKKIKTKTKKKTKIKKTWWKKKIQMRIKHEKTKKDKMRN